MLFNSNIFVYCFLPAVMLCYYIATRLSGVTAAASGRARLRTQKRIVTAQNVILLIFSLFFYLWGSGYYFFLLAASILGNYLFGLGIHGSSRHKKLLLVFNVVFNLGLLIVFKYFNFLYENAAPLFSLFGLELPELQHIVLPVGISFFTFQAFSYVIDVYRGTVGVQRNVAKLALFISFFPQLIAGPIVRYSVVEKALGSRKSTKQDIYEGACRFCFGLAKKVLLANTFGTVVDKIFALGLSELTTPLAWTGLFLYTLQIYFDFSAYSDMAIGIARVFGFHFNENFLFPYLSKNITEFWRRWHVSLSTFFRDYLYIPLGGNRKGALRTYINLAIVFLLCGFWHGASWTFVIWGLYHGVLLVIERVLFHRFNFQTRGVIGQIIAFLLVMLGWLIFRSPDIGGAIDYLGVMFGNTRLEGFQYFTYWFYVNAQTIVFAAFAFAISILPFSKLRDKYRGSLAHGICAAVLLGISLAYMSDASFSPFIYFQF